MSNPYNASVDNGAEVVAKGFPARCGAADGALVFARGVGGSAREVSFSRVDKLATRSARIAPVLRLGVQLLIDRLATPIFRAIAS
jgi:hypothetical protein